jgi:hypothetical protein
MELVVSLEKNKILSQESGSSMVARAHPLSSTFGHTRDKSGSGYITYIIGLKILHVKKSVYIR